MESDLLKKLAARELTKDELYRRVERDFRLLPEVLSGMSSSKATVRYGCGKVLMDLSAKYPAQVYPYFDSFVALLGSKYRILRWNALGVVANLCAVDANKKFDDVFDTYFGYLNEEYMVTVANVVGNASKIALAKPYLIPKIVDRLLKVDELSTTPHLTEECKRVVAEKTIESFSMFFDKMDEDEKAKGLLFAENHLSSSRVTLKKAAELFLKKWNK
jgi:hypothetical protein